MPRYSLLRERVSGPAAAAWNVGDRAHAEMRRGRDVIHLGVGDPDLDTPPHIRAALTQSLESGRTHYSPLIGEHALRSAVAAHATRLYGTGVAEDEVFIAAGAQGALYAVFQLIAGPGDDVIVLEPSYATYPAVVTAGGARIVTVALDAMSGYQPDLAVISDAITPRTTAILINSPGNPSGTVMSQATMNALADLAAERDIWLVSDEVYWALCYDVSHTSPIRRSSTRSNVIVVNSLSKSHAMTGWRIGWVIGPAPFAQALATFAQSFHFGVNQFVQDAAAIALGDDAVPTRIRDVFRSRRDALISELRGSDVVRFAEPQGGMFLLLDVSASGQDGRAFAESLLDVESVAVVPGFGFGSSVAHTVRVGFLCEEGLLAEAAVRIVRHASRRVR